LPVALPPKASWIVAESVTDWVEIGRIGAGWWQSVVVVAPLTTWLNAAAVCCRNRFGVCPRRRRVTECVPTLSAETASCAELEESGAVPSEVEPSRKVTVPVAVVPAGD